MCRIHQRKEVNAIRIGSFNTRGLKSDIKINDVATDMDLFKIDALAIQETHLTGSGVKSVITTNGRKFTLFYGGIKEGQGRPGIGGVGIMVREGIKAEFKEDEQEKREEELALGEIRREKELVLKGILETPYQPRKRHPLTKHVMDSGSRHRKRSRHSKSTKSMRKFKTRNSPETTNGESKSKLPTSRKLDNSQHDTTESESPSKMFTTSTFGDVFQRLSATMTTRPSGKEEGMKGDSSTRKVKISRFQDNLVDEKRKPLFTTRKKPHAKRRRKKSKVKRRLLRIRTVQPNDDVTACSHSNHKKDLEDENTLISQLKADLFI